MQLASCNQAAATASTRQAQEIARGVLGERRERRKGGGKATNLSAGHFEMSRMSRICPPKMSP
jgi:hypothetical protein